jgi:hypothetical protein
LKNRINGAYENIITGIDDRNGRTTPKTFMKKE